MLIDHEDNKRFGDKVHSVSVVLRDSNGYTKTSVGRGKWTFTRGLTTWPCGFPGSETVPEGSCDIAIGQCVTNVLFGGTPHHSQPQANTNHDRNSLVCRRSRPVRSFLGAEMMWMPSAKALHRFNGARGPRCQKPRKEGAIPTCLKMHSPAIAQFPN